MFPPLPETLGDFKPSSEIDDVEDLYLTGRWVEQLSRPYLDADDYYLKALRISPDDYRVNLALGIRRVTQWRYAEAEKYLEKAALKLKYQYIQPAEGDLYYYWALAQRAQGKMREAYRNFSYAAYHYAWYSAANYQLAQMESERGDIGQALKYIDDAYSTNNRDAGIVVLYSALLRKVGRSGEALSMLEKALEFDPLNYALLYEKELVTGQGVIEEMKDQMQDAENNYIEIGINYLNAGMYDEAVNLFSRIKDPHNPLFLYYQAYVMANSGQESAAKTLVALANRKSFDYVFPYRTESEKVLRHAAKVDPNSVFPPYLLGNLLYDHRPEEAIIAWDEAAKIDSDFPMLWRNLAFGAFHHQKNPEKAIEYLTKALIDSPDHPYWYSELAEYYEASDRDPRECLAILDSHIETVKRDVAAPKDLVNLYNLTGEYDKAIDLLTTHHFRTWEGGREIYWYYVDAHVLKALALMKENKDKEAVEYLKKALLYPENLEVGKPLDDERNAMIYYVMAQAMERTGNRKEAQQYYRNCVEAKNSHAWPDLKYYQALALQRMGDSAKAIELLDHLAAEVRRRVESLGPVSGIGVEEGGTVANMKSLSEGYYLQGLASLGKGKELEAEEFFIKSLDAYRYNLWAKYYLENF